MAENTSNTPTSGATTRKPAARSNRSRTSSRSRSGSAANRNRSAGGGATIQTAGGGATPNAQNDDWRALNRTVSRYMAGHPNASIGETTVGELLAWAEQKRPRTMTAGGGAHA